MTTSEELERYIFEESDLEDKGFSASQFVARFRRVCPLEVIRDQLRAYSVHLKGRLYSTIHDNYKSFIHIATKVDYLSVLSFHNFS